MIILRRFGISSELYFKNLTIYSMAHVVNIETRVFLEKLKLDPNVIGVILFWSWARGNVRPGSDVDLVVILRDGYSRSVEKEGGQIFEIIYITADGAFDFWNSHRNDAAGLWEVAKILYDKDGSIDVLAEKIRKILKEGKEGIHEAKLWQFRFDTEDQLSYAEYIFPSDRVTANMLLANNVTRLMELFFDVQKIWTPAPKQRIETIRSLNSGFYVLIQKFYEDEWDFHQRINLVKNMISIVFD